MSDYDSAIVWMRRDLRLDDNTALQEATLRSENVFPVFVYDTQILDELEDRDDRRVSFIHDSVQELVDSLSDRGKLFLTSHGDPTEIIPQLAKVLGVDAVLANRDYEPYARTRDGLVKNALGDLGIEFLDFKDQVVFEQDEVSTADGDPYRVYSPYAKAWKSKLEPMQLIEMGPDVDRVCSEEDLPPRVAEFARAGNHSLEEMGFAKNATWVEPGQRAARDRLDSFLEQKVDDYGNLRDHPAEDATSGLSVHLRHGTLSIRECFRKAMAVDGKGAEKWVSELIWREFYSMVLACNPELPELEFNPVYRGMEWPGDPLHLDAWKEGRTGYPIIDAAMRCLVQTGWMHNRLRMVTASFLTKDLLLDWRLGEAHFARHLLDFELASNNGGWQWSASTGADPQPYFRIFNPLLQGKKFDQKCEFIRKWVPEVREWTDGQIHDPLGRKDSDLYSGGDYPSPIVDHFVQREWALALFSSVKSQ